MTLTGLKENALKLIMFGGKGGVGKTTCAASTAILLAKDFKTLLVSTDPAHSLSDSLGQRVGDSVTEIRSVKNLSVREIDAEKALAGFKTEYEEEIKKILDTSTNLDPEDIDSVFSLSIPGVDEVMGFKAILDHIETGDFDKYIVDTAPTGHALRLLTMPQLLDDWVKMLARLRWKYRYVVRSFSGKYALDEADDFLLDMKKTVKKLEGLLKDPDRCEFVAVTIPEDMAIQETSRLVASLNEYGVKVRQLVINNVSMVCTCEFCRERRKEQEKYINQIKKKFANLKITLTFLQPREIKGVEDLSAFAQQLAGSDPVCRMAAKTYD